MNYNYSRAKRLADKNNLVIVENCHASLPPGVPSRDHYGNYVTARTVYIGRLNTAPKFCAYGRCVFSIHQRTEPTIEDALLDIGRQLQYYDTFQSRESYIEYFRPVLCGATTIDLLAEAWCDISNTAQRAIKYLPSEILAFLRDCEY